ncbi:MAG: XdhC/CoxI family protein, partial [Chloroflexota bacterium]
AEVQPVALATLMDRNERDLTPQGKLFVETDGASHGSLGDARLDERAIAAAQEALRLGTARTVTLDERHELLVEPVIAKPRLVVAGGGHVGLALAAMAAQLAYEVTVIDDRVEYSGRERFGPGIDVVRMDMATALRTLPMGWNSFIVIATRGHKLDAQWLRDEGLAEDRIRRVHAPIGLDLGGRTPAEIALSVLAEMSMERYGGSGRPLRLADEIHDRAVIRRR